VNQEESEQNKVDGMKKGAAVTTSAEDNFKCFLLVSSEIFVGCPVADVIEFRLTG